MSFWVYILRCIDGSYYTGHTDNLETRIVQYVTGAIPSCYTFNRRPVECVFSQEFPTREEALASEQQIKGWSRKKKEAMVRGDWAQVSRLARSSVRPVCEFGEHAKGERLADTGLRQAQAERKIPGALNCGPPRPLEFDVATCDIKLDITNRDLKPEGT